MFLSKPFQIFDPKYETDFRFPRLFPSYKLALQNYPQIFLFLQPEKNLEYIYLTYIQERGYF